VPKPTLVHMLVEAYIVILEKFAHSLEETEVVKEADEHVRFAVPQAVPPPVYRTACHGHVSLYVTANTGKPAGRENEYTIIHFPGVRVLGLILFCFCICFVLRIMYCATLVLTFDPPLGHHVPGIATSAQIFF